ncbi:MAG: hypothetical protein ABF289_15110 [Clostridiales bacterium]
MYKGYDEIFDIEVYLTLSFIKNVSKEKADRDRLFLNALSNIKYGYNKALLNSIGGKDGVFNVYEDYKPKNSMIKKLYDNYINNSKNRKELEGYFKLSNIQGVRIVAHGMRILGFINKTIDNNKTKLVLINVDINKK